MPHTCAAFGCTNNNMKYICKEKKISFHLFPLKEPERTQWLIKLRRKNFVPTEYSHLCSEHFTEDCFIYQNFTNRRGLKPGAIPTLFSYIKTSKRKRTSYEFGSKQYENADNLKKKPGRKRKKIQSKEITSDEVSNSPVLSNQTSCFNLLDDKDKSECVRAVSVKVEEPWEKESIFTPKPIGDNSQVCDKLQIEIKEVRSVSSSFSAEAADENQTEISETSSQIFQAADENKTEISETSSQIFQAADENKTEISETSSQIFQAADENKTEISETSSHFARPLKVLKREKIFGTLVASELSDLSVNPELYLKTKRAILDILIQAHFELINCDS